MMTLVQTPTALEAATSQLVVGLLVVGIPAVIGLLIAGIWKLNRIWNLLYEPGRGLVWEMRLRRERDHDLLDAATEHRYRIRTLEDKAKIAHVDVDEDMAKLRRRRAEDLGNPDPGT